MEDIVYNQGELHVEGAPDRSLTIKEVAKTAYLQVDKLPRRSSPAWRRGGVRPHQLTWPFGTHLAVVEIDRETGDVELKRMIAVDDSRRIIAPCWAGQGTRASSRHRQALWGPSTTRTGSP